MYTPAQEQAVREAAPLDLAKAKVVAEAIGMSYRSVIAKAKSIGVEYIAKPAPTRKAKEATKADLAVILRAGTGKALVGLEKAPRAALLEMMDFLAETAEVAEAAEAEDTARMVAQAEADEAAVRAAEAAADMEPTC